MVTLDPLDSGAPGIHLHLEELEAGILLSLTHQMIDFVGQPIDEGADPLAALVGIDPEAAPSDDPALRRLLPDAFVDDDEASAEFRRFTERELRDGKVRHALDVQRALEEQGLTVCIEGPSVSSWLGFLNDTRLVLGARLELTEDNQEELADLPDDDPRAALFGLYGWLTHLQESVVQALLGDHD
jgi:hypothetical protein